jgi:hypothetical protein
MTAIGPHSDLPPQLVALLAWVAALAAIAYLLVLVVSLVVKVWIVAPLWQASRYHNETIRNRWHQQARGQGAGDSVSIRPGGGLAPSTRARTTRRRRGGRHRKRPPRSEGS